MANATYDSRPAQSRHHRKLWGAKSTSNNINQWSSYQFQNVKPICANEKHPADDFLSTVLDPQFVSFLPRRIEDSATAIWVYLYKQCEFVETFFQRESNV